jgi:hypothetical protein
MIKIEKTNDHLYLITDTDTGSLCLTRDELGQLHHLIDVQFMSEDPNYEESMKPLTQEQINNDIAYDDHKNKWST